MLFDNFNHFKSYLLPDSFLFTVIQLYHYSILEFSDVIDFIKHLNITVRSDIDSFLTVTHSQRGIKIW